MKSRKLKRRISLTLLSDTLMQVERIARTRKMNLSAVVSEMLSDGLRAHTNAERSEQVLRAYKKAFAGFSDQEMLILDGVSLDPVGKHK
jgi:hypothetical protein